MFLRCGWCLLGLLSVAAVGCLSDVGPQFSPSAFALPGSGIPKQWEPELEPEAKSPARTAADKSSSSADE